MPMPIFVPGNMVPEVTCRDEIKAVEKEIKELISSSEELSLTYRILTSIKGISFVNAVALIIYTLNFRKFGHDTRCIATYWGVTPFGRDSGTTLHTTPHVSITPTST